MKTSEKNVALVLSSGGARGMAHVGVIEAGREAFHRAVRETHT